MENISSDQILGYLKGKYLSKSTPKLTTTPTNNDNKENSEKLPVGEESDLDGEMAENTFLFRKLSKAQNEVTKWLDILKGKIK